MNESEFEFQDTVVTPARDPEEAQRALARVQSLLEKQRRVESLVHREQTPAEEKKALVEQLVHKQHLTELKSILERLHPADIAYILEALPLDERLRRLGQRQGRARRRDPARGLRRGARDPDRVDGPRGARRCRREPRRRRDRRARPRPAGRRRRGGQGGPDAGRARAVACLDELSGGERRRAHGLRARDGVRRRHAGSGAAPPAALRRAARSHRPGVRRRPRRRAQGRPAARPHPAQRARRAGHARHEVGHPDAGADGRHRRGGAGLRALQPRLGAGGRLGRPPGRPPDDRRGGRRDPRRGRGAATGPGRPARRGGPVRDGVEFGQEPLALAGGESRHGVFRLARDRRLRDDDRARRRPGHAHDHRHGHRRQFRQPDDDADDPVARARSGDRGQRRDG